MKPYCCGKEAKWIDYGDKLKYYFCEGCKQEVLAPESVEYNLYLEDSKKLLTQEEIDAIFDKLP